MARSMPRAGMPPSDSWSRRGLYMGLGLAAVLVLWWALAREPGDAAELTHSFCAKRSSGRHRPEAPHRVVRRQLGGAFRLGGRPRSRARNHTPGTPGRTA